MPDSSPSDETGGISKPESGTRTGRGRAIWRRWGDIFLLSLAGASSAVVVGASLPSSATEFLSREPALGGLAIPIGVLAIVLWAQRARNVGFLMPRRRFLASYPPTSMAAFLAAVLVGVFWYVAPGAADSICGAGCRLDTVGLGLVLVGILLAGFGPLLLFEVVGKLAPGPSPGPPPQTTFEDWLDDDAEIDHPNRDLFDLDRVARRIAERLSVPLAEAAPAISAVGPLGAGKTSLCRLVQHHLQSQDDPTVLLIRTSVWPFETPEAAVRGILGNVIRSLELLVGRADFSEVPGQYIRALEKSGTYGGIIAQLLGERPPESILAHLDRVAAAIEVRLVIWIEDLERFAASEGDAHEELLAADRQRLSTVRALLHLLDRHHNVCVVVASTSLAGRFDLEKIARFIERVPPLTGETVHTVLRDFRREMRSSSSTLPQDAASPAFSSLEVESNELTPGDTRFKDLATLCRTPRTLKSALRSCREVWRKLEGEIDFDDMLSMCVVRAANPTAFALVEANIEDLRWGTRLAMRRAAGVKSSEAAEELAEVACPTRAHRKALSRVLRDVFPALGGGEQDELRRPQGFGHMLHTDYWRRFLVIPDLDEDERDQPVLQAIDAANRDSSSGLVQMVADGDRVEAVESFARYLDDEALLVLFKELVRLRLGQDPAGWVEEETGRWDVPGLVPVWRMLRRRTHLQTRLGPLVVGLVSDAMRQNLTVAESLAFYFANEPSSQISPTLTPEDSELVRAEVERGLLALAADGPKRVARALVGAPRLLLYRLAWGIGRIRAKAMEGLPFEGWPDFSAALVAALQHGRETVMEQILPFVVAAEEREVAGPVGAVVQEENGRRLFEWDRLRDDIESAALVLSNPRSALLYSRLADHIAARSDEGPAAETT